MKVFAIIFTLIPIIMNAQSTLTLYDFKEHKEVSGWTIVNDVVMGGRSDAALTVNEEGVGVFSGDVSLENNGGFASMRLRLSVVDLSGYTTVNVRLKSEPNRFQFRCKSSWNEPQSYISYFETTGEWQEVSIPLRTMYPTFRGNRLDMPDFPAETLAEIAILIGNKKEESFRLEIDRIWLD